MKNKFVLDRIDFSPSSQREMTSEGYLSVPATIARIGIQEYSAGAIDMPGVPENTRVKVYRPPNEVFNQQSIDSFSMKPVTNGHPDELVNIDNIKKYSVGNCGSIIEREGDMLKTHLLITDKVMITAVDNGKCEISNGYVADFDYTAGTTETGEQYDAIMTNIRGNHIAIVDQARGGRGLRLSDEKQTGENMKKIVFDGIEIEVTPQGEQAIAKLQGKLKVVGDSITAKDSEIVTLKAGHDSAIAVKDQEIADAKALIIDAAEMERRVASRGQLVLDAKGLFKDVVTADKSEDQIIESVVVECCDGIEAGSKSADYCKARFDALLAVKDSADDGHNKVTIDAKAEEEAEEKGEKAREKFGKDGEEAYKMKKKEDK